MSNLNYQVFMKRNKKDGQKHIQAEVNTLWRMSLKNLFIVIKDN